MPDQHHQRNGSSLSCAASKSSPPPGEAPLSAELQGLERQLEQLAPAAEGLDLADFYFRAGQQSVSRTGRLKMIAGSSLVSSLSSIAATLLVVLFVANSNEPAAPDQISQPIHESGARSFPEPRPRMATNKSRPASGQTESIATSDDRDIFPDYQSVGYRGRAAQLLEIQWRLQESPSQQTRSYPDDGGPFDLSSPPPYYLQRQSL